jgi:biopolymer transport protein TolR
MVRPPRSGRLISSCDFSAFALVMTFSLFAVLAVVIIAIGTIPHHSMGPDLPRVSHARVVGYLAWGANRDDAMIAVVSRDGRIYFGLQEVTSAELPAKIQERLSKGSERRLYIKADKRARYGAVEAVLEAMQSAGVEQVSILADEAPPSSPLNLEPSRRVGEKSRLDSPTFKNANRQRPHQRA